MMKWVGFDTETGSITVGTSENTNATVEPDWTEHAAVWLASLDGKALEEACALEQPSMADSHGTVMLRVLGRWVLGL